MVAVVGRERELAQLSQSAARVLYVHAPAGEGKTALVRAWLERIDTPWTLAQPQPRDELLARVDARPHIVWIDDWSPDREPWLIDLLASSPSSLRVVLCARVGPSLALRAGVSSLMALSLDSLSLAASRAVLGDRSGPFVDEVLARSHGNPLLLSALAACGESDAQARRACLGQLRRRFVDGLLAPRELDALESVAPLRYVGESQLMRAAQLTAEEARAMFERLRELSFVRQEPCGLSIHRPLRELLLDELTWRAPERVRSIIAEALPTLRDELATAGPHRERAIETMVDLMAHAPGMWLGRAAFLQDSAPIERSAAHLEETVELVRAHEGEASAAIARRWIETYPERALVSLDRDGRVVAMAVRGVFDSAAPPSIEDPLLDRVLAALRREGDPATIMINRFFCGRTTHQALSAELMPVLLWLARDTLVTAHQAHLTVVREGPAWAPMIANGLFPVLDGARVPIGAHRYLPLGAALSSQREASDGFMAMLAHVWGIAPPAATLAGAAPAEFERAVAVALRWIDDPLGLERLALARMLRCSGSELQRHLRAAADELVSMPDGARVKRAVLARSETDSAAAAAASVAMSLATYKRYRKRGERRISEVLWRLRRD